MECTQEAKAPRERELKEAGGVSPPFHMFAFEGALDERSYEWKWVCEDVEAKSTFEL